MSQNAYITKVLENFGMASCDPNAVPIQKGDKFSQCPQTELEHDRMKGFSYAFLVKSLGYISFAVDMFSCHYSNPGIDH